MARLHYPAPGETVRVVVAALVMAAAVAPAAARQAESAPGGPLLDVAAQAEFLRTARVVRARTLDRGVTRSTRLTLTDGRVTHDAAFQAVEERRTQANFGHRGVEFNFADSHHFNLAAYTLAGLLGVQSMMPVTVHRNWNGKNGTLTWWIDDAFDESTRLKGKREPPSPARWTQQMDKLRVFAALVGDTDRNLGNILITPDWTLWMIDFTRAFRLWDTPRGLASLRRVDRTLLQRMRELDRETVRQVTAHCLTGSEADAVLKRRDRLIAHFDALIAERGAGTVLYGAEPKEE